VKAGRRDLGLEVRFEGQVRRLPAAKRARLFGWLRGRRRRVFWVMDTATGEWREV
jgi:hypothetical protein